MRGNQRRRSGIAAALVVVPPEISSRGVLFHPACHSASSKENDSKRDHGNSKGSSPQSEDRSPHSRTPTRKGGRGSTAANRLTIRYLPHWIVQSPEFRSRPEAATRLPFALRSFCGVGNDPKV